MRRLTGLSALALGGALLFSALPSPHADTAAHAQPSQSRLVVFEKFSKKT